MQRGTSRRASDGREALARPCGRAVEEFFVQASARRADLSECSAMNDSVEALRAKYRRLWDVHQVIADQNARLEQAGKQPSDEQLINEQRSAEAVRLARDELLAAAPRLDQ